MKLFYEPLFYHKIKKKNIAKILTESSVRGMKREKNCQFWLDYVAVNLEGVVG